MNDEQMRDLFQELRDEPLPPDSLARVRMAVSERISQPVRHPFWLQWQVLAAAMAAVVLLVIVSRPPAPAPAPQPPVLAKQEPLHLPPAPLAVEKPQPPHPKPPQAKVHKRPQKIDSLIRLETPNPNVVIFLVADGAGE